jgi:hypothetical protein
MIEIAYATQTKGDPQNVKNQTERYRRLSTYLLLVALVLVLLAFLLGPNLPLLLVGVIGLGAVSMLLYSSYRRDLRGK